jgi:hypothetical protein
VPELAPLRSVEDLLTDLQRLCQRQVEFLCQDRAGGSLAAVLTGEEMDLVGQLARTLKLIGDKVPQGEGEDLTKLSSDELERKMRAK